MKNSKIHITIDTLIKLGVGIMLVVAATTKQQYSFYSFLRWAVMIPSIYFAYKSLSNKQIGLLIYFLATAILFNPFKKIWFQKETWHIIDYLVTFILLVTIIYDWIKKEK